MSAALSYFHLRLGLSAYKQLKITQKKEYKYKMMKTTLCLCQILTPSKAHEVDSETRRICSTAVNGFDLNPALSALFSVVLFAEVLFYEMFFSELLLFVQLFSEVLC